MNFKNLGLVLIILISVACGGGGRSIETDELPELSGFFTSPTSQFLVDFENVAHTSPFVGQNNNLPHDGAHVHFENTGALPEGSPADSYPAIYAIADGTISQITTYEAVDENYKYSIFLEFAQDNGEAVNFEYSIEPFTNPGNETFYEQFILVTVGQEVKVGDTIATMYVPVSSDETSAHIHFALKNGETKQAPVIFNSFIETDFIDKLSDGELCMGIDLTAEENPEADESTDCI